LSYEDRQLFRLRTFAGLLFAFTGETKDVHLDAAALLPAESLIAAGQKRTPQFLLQIVRLLRFVSPAAHRRNRPSPALPQTLIAHAISLTMIL